jgi:hypothetical protein
MFYDDLSIGHAVVELSQCEKCPSLPGTTLRVPCSLPSITANCMPLTATEAFILVTAH